jgi:hypothetical protein
VKTQDEIVDYIKKTTASGDNFFGFVTEAMIEFLDFDHAKEFLKPETDPAKWKVRPLTEESVLGALGEYMEFAWGKVEDHRGISAERSVNKCTAWAWILRGEDIVAKIDAAPYPQYGAPKLAVICEAFGLPIPDSEDIQRMRGGRRCNANYDCGCGFA